MPIPFILAGIGALGATLTGKACYDNYQANDVNNSARSISEQAEERLEKRKISTNNTLQNYGKRKLDIFKNEINTFVNAYGKLKNVDLTQSKELENLEVGRFTEVSFNEMRHELSALASATKGFTVGLGSGALVAYGAYTGAMTFGAASTGAAISGLSGVAATNATLAWLGGGTLAAGGTGVAGGTMVLGTLVAGPALLIFGGIFAAKASEKLSNAKSNLLSAEDYAEEVEVICTKLGMIDTVTSFASYTLVQVAERLKHSCNTLENTISTRGVDYSLFSKEEKHSVFKALKYAEIVKAIIDAPILNEKGELIHTTREKIDEINEKNFRLTTEKEHRENIQNLLNSGESINSSDSAGTTPLMVAVRTGYIDLAKDVISRGAHVNVQNNEGITPLMIACAQNDAKMVQLLLDYYADTEVTDNEGRNAFIYACIAGSINIVKLLFEYDEDQNKSSITTIDKNNYTSLMHAVKIGNLEIVKFLVKAGLYNPMYVTFSWQRENDIFFLAIEHGHLEIVRFLIAKGTEIVDLQKYDSDLSVIEYAAQYGHVHIIELLLGAGATIYDGSILKVACENGHLNVVKFLMKNAGRNLDDFIEKGENRTAPHIATIKGHLDIVDYLLDEGYDINTGFPKSFSHKFYMDTVPFLGAALMCEDVHVVKYLFQKGADPNISCTFDYVEHKVLDGLLEGNKIEMMQVFLENGAILSDENMENIIENDNVEMFKVAFNAGVESARNISVLYTAASRGHVGIMKCLTECQNNGEYDIKSQLPTIFQLAGEEQHDDIIKLLVAKYGLDALVEVIKDKIRDEIGDEIDDSAIVEMLKKELDL